MRTPAAPSPLDIVRTQSLTTLVQQELERMIIAGELAPGERLNELALASKLGISRGPIREATRGLERAGLVTAVVNHGVFVREISVTEASDLYDLRVLLSGYACERLAETATDEQRALLTDLVDRMDQVQGEDHNEQYYPLNIEFHDRIVEFAGNARAAEIYAGLVKQTHLFRRKSLTSARNMGQSNAEHRAMLEAILSRDAASARHWGEQHVRNGKQRFLATLKEAPPGQPT